MSTAAAVSISQYLASSFRPDREYIDGEVVEHHIGEREHSSFQMMISSYLYVRRQELGIVVLPEQRVQVSATRFRVPDISVTLALATITLLSACPMFGSSIRESRGRFSTRPRAFRKRKTAFCVRLIPISLYRCWSLSAIRMRLRRWLSRWREPLPAVPELGIWPL